MMIRKMLTVILAVLIILSIVPFPAGAREIGGKSLPEEITVGKDKLVLNGAGIRVKWFMDIYAVGLYLKNKSQDPTTIMETDEPMVIKIVVISGMMNDQKLIASLQQGYKKATKGDTAPIKERINKFLEAHKGDVNSDDVVEYRYVPGKGLSYHKNGNPVITIEGLDYKKAHFGIWLGDKPCQENLKKALVTITNN